MRRIVVACDSFKGSLSSEQVAEAAGRGIHAVYPDCAVHSIPIADGGEGTTCALMETLNGQWVEASACDPLMRPVKARYGIGKNHTAIIESASASGLTLLAPVERNPMLTSTYGTGELIADALGRGCRDFIIGLGGSATNDAGVGMLRALGFRFRDAQGYELQGGGQILSRIASIDASGADKRLTEVRFRVACDVTNPLLGERGTTRIFAPQKGAAPGMVEKLEQGMAHFARVLENFCGRNIAAISGAGAAGGLGAAFAGVLGAKLLPGIDMVLEAAGFDALMQDCELVITGEGRMDSQTAMGKAPQGVLHAARRHGVPVVAIAGGVEDSEALLAQGFTAVIPIQPACVPLEEAMRPSVAAHNVEQTVRRIMERFRAEGK